MHTAADLWDLVHPRRGDAIRAWIREAGNRVEDEEDLVSLSYGVEALRDLVGLLDGLGDALRAEVTDEHWRLDPATAARLKALDETLVDSWDVGGHVDTLENRVSEVLAVEWLARRAIGLGRPLVLG